MLSPAHDRWPAPSPPHFLEPDEAHVWRTSLLASDAHIDAFAQTLSADERERAARFRFAIHRRRFVAGRGKLRSLLGRYLGHAPADLEFAYSPNGKPSLARSPNARSLFFNASHTEDCAMIAVTWVGEIGVDAEQVRPIPEWRDIARCILAPDPDAEIPSTLHEFFKEWTRHEARVKATGLGLGGQPAGEGKLAVHSLSLEKDLFAAVAFPAGVKNFTVAGF
ncbi:MAG: hypothetical protein Q7S40_11065 [Opitutaceae bacterium]|nr:hypothetical protein [Opitutaceae bacterium]